MPALRWANHLVLPLGYHLPGPRAPKNKRTSWRASPSRRQRGWSSSTSSVLSRRWCTAIWKRRTSWSFGRWWGRPFGWVEMVEDICGYTFVLVIDGWLMMVIHGWRWMDGEFFCLWRWCRIEQQRCDMTCVCVEHLNRCKTSFVLFSRGTIHVLCAIVQRSGHSTCGYHGWSLWRTCYESFQVLGWVLVLWIQFPTDRYNDPCFVVCVCVFVFGQFSSYLMYVYPPGVYFICRFSELHLHPHVQNVSCM